MGVIIISLHLRAFAIFALNYFSCVSDEVYFSGKDLI